MAARGPSEYLQVVNLSQERREERQAASTAVPPVVSILRPAVLFLALSFTSAAFAQSLNTPPVQEPPHDIRGVDPVSADAAMATPLPVKEQRRLRKYDLPELTGSRQAIGSQLIDGHLPKPMVDYFEWSGELRERISIFEGGLVVVNLTSPSVATIQKRVIVPKDALKKYLDAASAAAIRAVGPERLRAPVASRRATIRVYVPGSPEFVERMFDPVTALPKALNDAVIPLQDLMRALCEDRMVTNSVANYAPQPGDELVGDDRNVYRVVRVVSDQGIVELKCLTNPTTLYVKQADLANYFIGKPAVAK